MKKVNKKIINKLKPFWEELKWEQYIFNCHIRNIEKRMQKETKIKDIEFFYCDGYYGIGTASKSIKLIHGNELERE